MTFPRICVGIALGLSLACTLFAQDFRRPRQPLTARSSQQRVPDVFGTQTNIMQIPASAFLPEDSADDYHFTPSGYLMGPGNQEYFSAPVTLPTGTVIDFVDLYYVDLDQYNNISASLKAYSGSTSPVTSTLVTVSSTGFSGYGYAIGDLSSTPYTVNNDVEYGGGAALVIEIFIPLHLDPLGFRGVDIWWHRQVSPPPAMPTFSDVPTSSPQFKFIEALASAGITAGCGGGNYCPNDPITRGQMAVFLAQALGLHYPY